jgi:hypothetical protein
VRSFIIWSTLFPSYIYWYIESSTTTGPLFPNYGGISGTHCGPLCNVCIPLCNARSCCNYWSFYLKLSPWDTCSLISRPNVLQGTGLTCWLMPFVKGRGYCKATWRHSSCEEMHSVCYHVVELKTCIPWIRADIPLLGCAPSSDTKNLVRF